jgi:hypothetical protein
MTDRSWLHPFPTQYRNGVARTWIRESRKRQPPGLRSRTRLTEAASEMELALVYRLRVRILLAGD